MCAEFLRGNCRLKCFIFCRKKLRHNGQPISTRSTLYISLAGREPQNLFLSARVNYVFLQPNNLHSTSSFVRPFVLLRLATDITSSISEIAIITHSSPYNDLWAQGICLCCMLSALFIFQTAYPAYNFFFSFISCSS